MISRNNYIRNIFKIEVHLSYRWKFNFFTPVKNKSRPSFKDMYKEKREDTKKKTGKKLQNSCELWGGGQQILVCEPQKMLF